MDDPHNPRNPADEQCGHSVPPGWVDSYSIPQPSVAPSVFIELKDEVEALEEVSDGVPKADQDIEEEDPDHGEGCDCLQKRTLVILRVCTGAAPVAGITFGSSL